MRYVTRDQWGAKPPKYRNIMRRPVSLVVVHHTVTDPNADPYKSVRGVQAYHQGKGWSDIAYQELVAMDREHDGWVFEGRGFGFIGGATGTPPGDANSLSICLLGNAEQTPPTPAAVESIAQRLAYAEKIGRLAPAWEIRGDRDYNQTACPGAHLYAQLPYIRQRAAEIVAGHQPTPSTTEPEDDDMKWLYYHDESTGTEFVVTANGSVREYGPQALKQLRAEGVIPSAPKRVSADTARDFRAGDR